MKKKEISQKDLVAAILTAVVILLYPLLLIIFIPIVLYRFIINMIVKRDPKIKTMLSGLDASLCGKDPYNDPLAIIVPFYVISSKVRREQVLKVFTEQILKPTGNGGKCVFPEMTQYIVKRYGYYFWHENENFKLENHVKYLNEDDKQAPLTRREVHDYIANILVKSPFTPKQSPWDIHIVQNYIDSENPQAKSAILFRFNHCLFDGFSTVNFMQKAAVKPWKALGGEAKLPELTLGQRILHSIYLLIAGPFHFIKFIVLTNDNNDWVNKAFKNFQNRINYHETKSIRISSLKNIKNHFKVSLTTLLFGLVSESVRRAMERKNIYTNEFHICTPFPIPGHPDKLTNHWAPTKVPVLCHEKKIEKTLQLIDKEYKTIFKRPILPLTNWYISTLVGLLPIDLHPPPDLMKSTFLISNFAGPAHSVDMFGYEMVEFGYGGSTFPGFAIYAAILSYNGDVRIGVGGDASVLPSKQDAIEIIETIENILMEWRSEAEIAFD